MSISQIVKTKHDGSITISDGTAVTPKTLTIDYEAGDFNLSIPGPSVSNFLDRGKFGTTPSLRYGDDAPITFSFTANLRDLSDATYITLESIITNSGYFASDWVATTGYTNSTDPSEIVKTVKVLWTIEGSNHGDSADHTITLNHCVLTGSLQEGDPNTVSISGTAFVRFPVVS